MPGLAAAIARLLVGRRATRAEAEIAHAYVTLDCPMGADLGAVRRAYHRLVRRVHPDTTSGDPARQRRAHALTARLTAAYETLTRALS